MLKVNAISKTFNPGTVNEKKALSALSLHLEAGDFVTVIGSNGAGKSTLLNAVAGVFYAVSYTHLDVYKRQGRWCCLTSWRRPTTICSTSFYR